MVCTLRLRKLLYPGLETGVLKTGEAGATNSFRSSGRGFKHCEVQPHRPASCAAHIQEQESLVWHNALS